MTYLILGKENLINKEIKDLIEKNKIDNLSIAKYDLKEQKIEDAMDDINTTNLFNNKKVIIIKNIKNIVNEKILIEYLNNQNDNLLLITSTEKLDERKKITKEIKEKSKVIDLNNYDLTAFAKESLKDYKISGLDINTLLDYCGYDYDTLKNEIEKLKMYKLNEKEITKEDIKKSVRKNFDSNIFDLINNLNKKDKAKVFEIFYGLLDQKEDEIKIFVILANNYRLLYQIKKLKEEKTDKEIISIYNMNPYRLKKLKEQSNFYTDKELLKIMKDLSELDIAIKSGKIDKKTGLELFLASV